MATDGNITIRMSGYRETLRAFDKATQEGADIRSVFADVAIPMARHATGLAVSSIPKITTRRGHPWALNRVGVTGAGVYIVPQKRGTRDPRKRRPNFGVMLIDRAYDPTAALFEPVLVAQVERALDRIAHTFESGV